MCGIVGIVGKIDEENRQALRRMSRAVAHRGPDADGVFESKSDLAGNGVLFAHRRLSIIDLSDAAAQPMTDEAVPQQTMIFNGEIYNYRQLRTNLEAAGETFTSQGDTAVMLRLLARKGIRAIGDLRGMFAFALWDAAIGCVALARDPMGIKPLYICRNPHNSRSRTWSFMFASEIRAILASRLLGVPRLDPAAVESVVWNGFVTGPNTIVRGIELLPAGTVLVLDTQGQERARETFWRFPPASSAKASSIADVRGALSESVGLHLVGDVPLGVFLSGGIDSSTVANLAARASGSRIHTFTLAFEEQEYDESPYSREIAKAIGTNHQEVVLTEQRFVGSLERALDSIDQPTFDALNSFYISEAVREAGVKVALLGTGGDELFGGYRSFRDLPRLQAIVQRLAWLPKSARVALARAVVRIVHWRKGGEGNVGAQSRWAKLPAMVASSNDLLHLYQLAYALFVPELQRDLLREAPDRYQLVAGLSEPLRADLGDQIASRSPLAKLSILEQRLFLGERLLRDTDVASMAVSLETRLPLVDSNVADVVSRLPDEIRYKPLGRKQVLRDIGLEGLDPALFDRAKRGFVMPFDRWIRQRLGTHMDTVMRDTNLCAAAGLNGDTVGRLWQSFHDDSPRLYWTRVWAIYVLLRWCDRHGVTAH